jgi:tetratricopeptide (TPR) repeat protein
VSGRVLLEGVTTPFQIELDQEPGVFWLDHFQEVFGQFVSESRWPRRVAFRRGLDLLAAGEFDEAESALLAAFDKPAVTEYDGWFGFEPDVEREGRQVDTSIHLELARLYLDQARTEDASTHLDMARQQVPRADRWYFDRRFLPLEGRLSLMSGQPDEAYRELKRGLSNRRSAQSAEAWALLAVAAHLTDRPKEYEQACRRALDRGVDLGPLTCP